MVQSVLNSSVSLKYENGIKGLKLSIEHYQSLSLVIACKLRIKMSSEKSYTDKFGPTHLYTLALIALQKYFMK